MSVCFIFFGNNYPTSHSRHQPTNQQSLNQSFDYQTRSQACVSGVANFSQRNHVVKNLRACFMLYVITIKWMMCVQEKIELTGTSKRPRLSSTEISGDLSLLQRKSNNKIWQESLQGWQETGIVLFRSGSCHLMPPVEISKILTRGALGATTPIFWMWPSCSHAHIVKAQI